MKKLGVLVRHFHSSRVDDYMRITVGSDNEMEALIKALKKIILDSNANKKDTEESAGE